MLIGSRVRILLAVAAHVVAACIPASANQILDLAEQSDVVVVGEATAMSSDELNTVRFALRVDQALKGDVPAGSSVSTTLRGLNDGMLADNIIRVPRPLPEMYGLWFLKRTADGSYDSIPRELVTYHFNGAVVRLPRSWTPPRDAPLDRALLSAALASYRHVRSNSDWVLQGEVRFAERLLRNSLMHADRFNGNDAAAGIMDELLSSDEATEQHIGIAPGLAVSYDAAIVRLTSDLESNRLDADALSRILPELWKYDSSTELGAARIERLLRWNQSAKVAGLDSALVGSLGHVSGPARLPLTALFLDSPERGAMQLAVRLFYLYSVLARNDGTVATDGIGGTYPYSNETTKAHSGNNLATLPADAEFWRTWWAEHRDDIAARRAGSAR